MTVKKNTNDKQLLGVKDGAALFGVNVATFRKLVFGAGFAKLNEKCIKVGNKNYWTRTDIMAALGLFNVFTPAQPQVVSVIDGRGKQFIATTYNG